MLGNHLSVSLDQVRKHFGMPLKMTPYDQFDGKRWHELSPTVQKLMAEGCEDEVESIYDIFCRFLKEGFPLEELGVVDSTIKMFTMPVLRADTALLKQVWEDEEAKRQARLLQLGVTGEDLRSADRFASLLREAGVEPETKDGKNGPIYAFAKNDQFMRDLLDGPDEELRTLAEARLGAKSTIIQDRCEKIANMASRGSLCVYYNYCGAHNTNWSGGDSTNFQNMKRGSAIRKAIMAPPGCLICSPDLSQVQCRLVNYLAGQQDVVERFRRGDDPYIPIAEMIYQKKVTKDDKTERGTGKTLELSCGFMSGDLSIQRTAKSGLYGPPVYIELAEARRWKLLYRETHPAVEQYWKTGGRMIARIAGGDPVSWGPFAIRDGKIFAPNGLFLQYPQLHFHRPTPEECEKLSQQNWSGYWRWKTRNGWKPLHPGVLTQNVVSFAARIILSQAMLRIKALGYHIMGTTHDELWVLLQADGNEERHREIIMNEMRREVSWLPGLPLDCEAEMGERYEH